MEVELFIDLQIKEGIVQVFKGELVPVSEGQVHFLVPSLESLPSLKGCLYQVDAAFVSKHRLLELLPVG